MCIIILFNLDSPYRDKISSIILKLQEDQTIQKFYNTWWKEKNKDGECIDSTKKQTNALTIKNVGGIFVVLIAGTMAGVVVAFFEFLWKARKNAKEDKVGILVSKYSLFFINKVLCHVNISKHIIIGIDRFVNKSFYKSFNYMRWEPFHKSVNIYDFIVSSFVKRSPSTLKRGGVERVAPLYCFSANGPFILLYKR